LDQQQTFRSGDVYIVAYSNTAGRIMILTNRIRAAVRTHHRATEITVSTTQYDTARELVKELAATLNAVIDAGEADDCDALELMMKDYGTVARKIGELNKAMVAVGLGEPFYE
jgi:hypothetical protein